VINRALNPAFSHDAPYTVAAVDLDEGARMIGRLLSEPLSVRPGLPVRASIYVIEGHRLVGFQVDQE
jgi:uncharacterized OB-fold protein